MAILGELHSWMQTDEFLSSWSVKERRLGEIVTWYQHRDGRLLLALFDSGHAKFYAQGDPEAFDTLWEARRRVRDLDRPDDVAA